MMYFTENHEFANFESAYKLFKSQEQIENFYDYPKSDKETFLQDSFDICRFSKATENEDFEDRNVGLMSNLRMIEGEVELTTQN